MHDGTSAWVMMRPMRKQLILVLSVATLGACQAYDRTQYRSLLDGGSDLVSNVDADVSNAADHIDAVVPVDAAMDTVVPADQAIFADVVDIASASDVVDVMAEVDVTATCVDASVTDPCVEIPALLDPPVIDGVPSCDVALQPFPRDIWDPTVTPTPPPDVTVEYATAWRPNGLYIFVRVHRGGYEPALVSDGSYCGDAVEIFADSDGVFTSAPNYDDPGARQLILPGPPSATTSVSVGDMYINRRLVSVWRPGAAVSVPFDGGYSVEALVTAPDLGLANWDLVGGGHIGFTLAVDVGQSELPGSCGRYLGQFALHMPLSGDGSCNDPACDPRAFCTPALLGP